MGKAGLAPSPSPLIGIRMSGVSSNEGRLLTQLHLALFHHQERHMRRIYVSQPFSIRSLFACSCGNGVCKTAEWSSEHDGLRVGCENCDNTTIIVPPFNANTPRLALREVGKWSSPPSSDGSPSPRSSPSSTSVWECGLTRSNQAD